MTADATTAHDNRAAQGRPVEGEAVQVAGAPAIPGLRFRRLRIPGDFEAIARIGNDGRIADGVDWVQSAGQVAAQMTPTGGFDPVADTVIAEVDGTCVAFVMTQWRLRDGMRTYTNDGAVLPAFRRRGLGRALLRHGESRARDIAAGHPDDLPKRHTNWGSDRETGLAALLEAEGYRPARWFFEMVRDPLDDLPEAPLPAGVELRPAAPAELARIMAADNEAFRDHWGHAEATSEDDARFLANPDLRPELWSVGWDGDEVAGSVLVSVPEDENEQLGRRRGWLDHVTVRRPWRGKGLASALMVASMRAMRHAGLTSAALGVDADSPTGAVRLYERLGFRTVDRSATWHKDMAPRSDATGDG